MIPKILHYVWVGPKPFPEDGRRNLESWQARCPDYELRLWSEDNIDFSARFVRQAYAAKAWNRVSNYVRMAALLKHGGIYLDHDIELRRSLDHLLGNAGFAGFQTLDPAATDIVNGALLAAVPRHPFVKRVMEALDRMDGRLDVGSGSGPGLISRLLRESGLKGPADEVVQCAGLTIYPPRYFYPYEWTETFSEDCVRPETVAVHHWAHLWKRNSSLPARIRRRLRGIALKAAPELMYSLNRELNRRSRG